MHVWEGMGIVAGRGWHGNIRGGHLGSICMGHGAYSVEHNPQSCVQILAWQTKHYCLALTVNLTVNLTDLRRFQDEKQKNQHRTTHRTPATIISAQNPIPRVPRLSSCSRHRQSFNMCRKEKYKHA
jgi:hypothetical protein